MDKREFNEFLSHIDKQNKPRLLMHVCCGPCSSYCMEYLNEYFDITLFYYNPNIYPESEYLKRYDELEKLNHKMYNLPIVTIGYNPSDYDPIKEKYADFVEGSARCYECMKLRMTKACEYAKENNFDYFTTTLSISPHKNSTWINQIGYDLQSRLDMPYLYSDFKKNNGYLESIRLCKKYGVYRQDYCGCEMSMRGKYE